MTSERFIILFAEDDEGHATLVQRNLRRTGIVNPVVHVRDGQEALDYIRSEGTYEGRASHELLLLLLDINMPRVDGVEVLRQLKSNTATAGIPVIMLTTTDDPEEIERVRGIVEDVLPEVEIRELPLSPSHLWKLLERNRTEQSQ